MNEMNDKSKIFLIYSVVALSCVLILVTTFYIRSQRVLPEQKPYYSEDSQFESLLTLEKDLVLKNQDGEEVKLSELKGKVWAFAQFYATCPMCAKRNSQGLKALYEKFKDMPDFCLVCITVNPEEDGVEQMKSYAEALEADSSNWLFLTGDAESLKDYMVSEMKYDPIKKRSDPEEAATKGALAHNMSIAVYNRDLSMVGRKDLSAARADGDKVYQEVEKSLHQMVDVVLKQK